ncbi:MAG: MBL fold metallo-hydrolase [Saprospiraceae bacterium]|nr:MBL fold metallo-hydrolase [Saprospiraceae bacterium]
MNVQTLDLKFLGLEHSIAVFVVQTAEGPVLVECGPASTLPHLELELSSINIKTTDIRHVFLSHIHFDHAGAAWAFAAAGAQIHVHPKGLPHLAAPEKLYNSARMIYGEEMDRLWGEMQPIAESQLHAPEHGEIVRIGGIDFQAWYTPGHAVHHIAWEVTGAQNQSVLFTGDVAGVKIGGGPVMPPCPPPDIHIEDWQTSIQLMRNLKTNRLFLTHYGEINDKEAHLDALEQRLLDWAAWMKPYFENETPAAEIVPLFQNYVQEYLKSEGVPASDLERYEAANPAFMSVAGLLRYWKKKTTQTQPSKHGDDRS